MKKMILRLLAIALVAIPAGAQNTGESNTVSKNNQSIAVKEFTQGASASAVAVSDTQPAEDTTSADTGRSSQSRLDVVRRLNDAAADLNRTVGAPDSGIPDTVLAHARCVAIVPTLLKGGFIFGVQHGRGVATCRTQSSWSAPAFFVITGGSWGAQIGGEGVDLIMLFMDDKGAEKLLGANWKIGGDASIAAGPWGRDTSANTNWKFDTSILTYSRARGVFIGATLNGANVRQDVSATRRFYGHDVNFRETLTGKVMSPPQAREFLSAIRSDFREANAAK